MRKFLPALAAVLILLLCGLTAFADTLPSWWKDEGTYVRVNDPAAPRVVDLADIFSDEEEAEMQAGIEKIAELGIDLVVFTDTSTSGQSAARYSEAFYYFNGYGLGDNFTGSVLFVCMDPDDRQFYTSATGDVEYLYTYDTVNILDDRLYPYMVKGDYGNGVIDYINNVYSLYLNPDQYVKPTYDPYDSYDPYDGYDPVSRGYDIMRHLVRGLILGAVVGFVSLFIKRAKMRSVKVARTAGDYQVPGSFRLWKSRDIYLYSNVTRVRRETEHRSSSHSGGSSHSSHSSFGGSHFSGGGRHF